LISGNAPNQPGLTTVTGGLGVLGDGGTNRPPFFAPNSFEIPKTAIVDLRLQKAFNITEGRKIIFSGDAFNLFNHTNFTSVDTRMYTLCAAGVACSSLGGTKPTSNSLVFNDHFGVPTGAQNTLIGPRQIQVGIRLDF
jgi:hypothetical protein